MSLVLHVEGDSFADVRERALRILQACPVSEQATAHDAPEPTSEPSSMEPKRPVGRPKKTESTSAAAPKVEKPKAYTLEQVRTALQGYAQRVHPDATVGIVKVRELLATYQSVKGTPCQKISEVQDQDYAAVVAACGA